MSCIGPSQGIDDFEGARVFIVSWPIEWVVLQAMFTMGRMYFCNVARNFPLFILHIVVIGHLYSLWFLGLRDDVKV